METLLLVVVVVVAYVARRWRLSIESNFEEPDKKHHGWNDDGRIHWVRKAFPNDVELLLVDEAEVQNSSDGTEDDADQVEMEYQDYKGLFLSKRYIDDKINFYPNFDGTDISKEEITTCKKLEEMVQKGFSDEEIMEFRNK